MAYISFTDEGITREQAEILRELNAFQQGSDSIFWKRIVERINADVDESQEALLGCPAETSLEARGVLALRWQQREAIRRDLLTFVQTQLDERQKLLEEVKEQNEHNIDSGVPGTDNQ